MITSQLTREEIEKVRPDLIEVDKRFIIDWILNEDFPLYHTDNFVFLFNTNQGHRRKSEPELARIVDLESQKLNLEPFNERFYLSTKKAQEDIFPIYQKVHDEYDISYKELMG